LADDNNQNQNNQQNQGGKNKGGGAGGGGNGLSLSAKFDASAPGGIDNMQNQIVGHASNAVGFIIGAVVAGLFCKFVKDTFKIKDVAPQQGGGGGQPAISHPGQIAKAINQLKSHPQMSEFMPKIKEALGD